MAQTNKPCHPLSFSMFSGIVELTLDFRYGKNSEKKIFCQIRPTFGPPRHPYTLPLIVMNDLTSKARALTNLLLNQGQCRARSGLQNRFLHQKSSFLALMAREKASGTLKTNKKPSISTHLPWHNLELGYWSKI